MGLSNDISVPSRSSRTRRTDAQRRGSRLEKKPRKKEFITMF